MTSTLPPLEYFGPTLLIFGVVSIVVYLLIIRPLLPNVQNNNNLNNANNNRRANGAATPRTGATPPASNNTSQKPLAQQKCTRTPPHLNSSTVAVNGGANVLLDGLVAFKYTTASSSAITIPDERRARARLLAQWLPDATPPAKGSCVAVAVEDHDDSLACPRQRQVLVLLATYYNLLVLVAVSAGKECTAEDRARAVQALRGENNNDESQLQVLTPALLPLHRIVFTSTVTGRVAFVRQLQRIELVLDFDPEVKGLLSRFGHRVIVYGNGDNNSRSSNSSSVSKLGRALL